MSTVESRVAPGFNQESQSLTFSVAAGLIGTILCLVVLAAVTGSGFTWALLLYALIYLGPPQMAFVVVNALLTVSAPVRVLLCLCTVGAVLALVGFAVPLGTPSDPHVRLGSSTTLLATALPAIVGFWLLAWFVRWLTHRADPIGK